MDVSGTERLSGDPMTPAPKGRTNGLHEAAQQFEAFLVAQMLRSARESGNSGFGGGTESDSASSTTLGMAEDALAKAVSQRGGFGIARLVEHQLASAHQQVTE